MTVTFHKNIGCMLFCSLLTMGAHANGKKVVKPAPKKKADLQLIEAYTQNTIGGAASAAPPPSGTFIVVRWDRQDSMPQAFFWRGEGGFLPCQIARVRKAFFKDPKNRPPGLEYFQTIITNDQIGPGDSLMLTPLTRAKYPVPKEIPATAKNRLYYKLAGDRWLSIPVAPIVKKKDVVLP